VNSPFSRTAISKKHFNVYGICRTTLELVACIGIALRFSLDITGVLENYDYSGPTGMAFCIFFDSATLAVSPMNGATACLVVIALDRYWKIVHAIHHRKRYRRWMMKVALFLPWLNGVATHFVTTVITRRIVDGICVTTGLHRQVCWPEE